MASIVSDTNGLKRIGFRTPEGLHKSLRLGRMSKIQARAILVRVEALITAKANGWAVDRETAEWLNDIDRRLRRRLVKVGLVDVVQPTTLGQLVDAYLERRVGTLQPQTVVRVEQGKKSLIAYFGADRLVTTVTEADAEDYRAALLTEGLAEATARKRCSDARVWFRYAARRGLIQNNPFEAVPTAAIATDDLAYISEPDAALVLKQLASPDLRLIFVLARWGGLRIISEPKVLTWDCIDWERNRIVVKSPKTARHAGHEQRVIPMFPELLEPLQDAFDRAEPGEAHVLPILQRLTSAALRKPMLKAITASGLTTWPRMWHNLRSSRQTDLEAKFPSHVVCNWLGNSTTIARRHYLQILDRDFERAVGAESALEKATPKATPHGADLTKFEQIPADTQNGETMKNPAKSEENLEFAGKSSDPDGI